MAEESCIVLVDDNEAHRKLIKRALRKAGIFLPVLESESLCAARALLFPCDLAAPTPVALIIDVNLSDGRGTSLVAEARAHERYSRIPIVVLSTSALEQDIAESFAHGADSYITKSQDPLAFSADMAQEVHSLLASRNS